MIPKKLLGRFGEKHACKYLLDNGYIIIENNYRCRYGEIDTIALKDGVLYFIEVKTRQNTSFGEPEESINHGKLKKIYLSARHYIYSNKIPEPDIRFDAISVSVRNSKISVKHINNIIQ